MVHLQLLINKTLIVKMIDIKFLVSGHILYQKTFFKKILKTKIQKKEGEDVFYCPLHVYVPVVV